MPRLLLILLITFLPSLTWAKGHTVFYVCAHPDDCILFMNPNLYDDIVQGTDKVVMIYLTAGDAGEPFGKNTSSYPYVRELASIEATRWMADIGEEPKRAQQEIKNISLHGHRVTQVRYANTISYFLRLPDGDMMGDGFVRYDLQSMKKLKEGEIDRLAPIDGSATYEGWQDVVGVLSAIVAREAPEGTDVTVHIAQPDVKENHADHSDHTTGATAMIDALGTQRCTHLYKHIGYAIGEMSHNLNDTQLQNKSGSFAVLSAIQHRLLGVHHWDEGHLPYLARNYYQAEILPASCPQK